MTSTTDLTTSELTFPAGFSFGTATAAYQIEGAAAEDGRRDSIWDAFCRVPGAVIGGDSGEVVCDHYHRMPADVDLIADLGLDTYRFSTSWARVCPDGGPANPAGVDFYSRLVDELLDRGVRPWLTLYHWDLPQALQEAGGWVNRDTAHRFADYAQVMVDALGDRVDVWTTLNEPWCSSFLSYAAGEHAPGHTSPSEAVDAAHHLLLAHGLGVQVLRGHGRDLTVGITTNHTVADPADPDDPGDVDAARRIDGAFNRVFLDPIFRGDYPADVLEDMSWAGLGRVAREGDMALISAPIDVLGVNYYNGGAFAAPDPRVHEPLTHPGPGGLLRRSPYVGSERVRGVSRGLPVTDMGWEIQPDGLTRLLLRLQREYTGPAGIPMVITENGAAFPDVADAGGFVQDHDRIAYLRDHLAAVHAALEQGADVRGYLVWSLLDNFEWAWGCGKRFGIVHVDFDTLERTPKASAQWYSGVARTGRVTLVS
ncbi:family 1 glycosylhydrolase [Propioniciclava coleopterorum]|uniref:beta-glucosidase n=1 Tax=Propioniciclava coleopterorum TaxID=2714937 RepID=A0A6G7Y7K0_9ACTN|nr:family 1 glycosylhydrolase [Propioniciclava coleopterorum]QIK72792.1 family 1 glycosylhydrolase [Propioniciclava coleopterorum]